MFGERPIEGDPLTGDTRDGGDNERLRAHEREVADGAAEAARRADLEDGEVGDIDSEPEDIAGDE